MSTPIIQVDNLGKAYRLGREDAQHSMLRDALVSAIKAPVRRWREMRAPSDPEDQFWALRHLSFDVGEGDVIGIVGRNGAGKSTLLKVLSRITEPSEGQVNIRGRVASLLEVGTGFHPELTGRENIYLNGAIMGMTRLEIQRKFDEIVEFAEIDRFLDTQVKRYSSGMYVRLAFAVAAHLDPEILIVDEVLAVGDAEFQKKCLGKMSEVTKMGRTILFVSHNMAAVRLLCGTCLLLDKGRKLDIGPAREIIDLYMGGEISSDSSEVHFSRPGRAPIWIVKACVLNDGIAASSLPMGSEFGLKIEFDAEPATLYPRFGFVITAADGTRVLGANNRYQPSTALASRVEHGSIVCRLGQVPLTPGTYSISLWLGDQASDWHIEPEAVTFKIVERDIWGLGRLPPTDGTNLWWPTEFDLSERPAEISSARSALQR